MNNQTEAEPFKNKAVARVATAYQIQAPEIREAQSARECLEEYYKLADSMGSSQRDKALRAAAWVTRLLAVVELPDTAEELVFDKWIEDIEKEERRASAAAAK